MSKSSKREPSDLDKIYFTELNFFRKRNGLPPLTKEQENRIIDNAELSRKALQIYFEKHPILPQDIARSLEKHRSRDEPRYNEVVSSSKELFAKKKWDLPENFHSFYKWYVSERHPFLFEDLEEYPPTIEQEDLILYNEYREKNLIAFSALPHQKTKEKQLKAPVIGLFCRLANESKLALREQNETVEIYCNRICTTFQLNYTVNVRKNFGNKETAKNIKKLKELIFPLIGQAAREMITEYLNSKNNKMYV